MARDHRYRIEGTLWAELNKTEKQKTVPHYSRGARMYQVSASGIAVNSHPSSGDTRDSQALSSRGKGQRGAEPRTHTCVWTCVQMCVRTWKCTLRGKQDWEKQAPYCALDILAFVFQDGSFGYIHLFSKSREVWGSLSWFQISQLLVDDPNFVWQCINIHSTQLKDTVELPWWSSCK